MSGREKLCHCLYHSLSEQHPFTRTIPYRLLASHLTVTSTPLILSSTLLWRRSDRPFPKTHIQVRFFWSSVFVSSFFSLFFFCFFSVLPIVTTVPFCHVCFFICVCLDVLVLCFILFLICLLLFLYLFYCFFFLCLTVSLYLLLFCAAFFTVHRPCGFDYTMLGARSPIAPLVPSHH